MKKIITIFSLLLTLFITSNNITNAMTYEEATKQSKEIAVLIYADWSDDIEQVKNNFMTMQDKYSMSYNFVLLNIADNSAKEYNKKYHIYPNLPYVMLFRSNGKVSRYLQKNCLLDIACFDEKIKNFIN